MVIKMVATENILSSEQYDTSEFDVNKIASRLFPGPDYMQWLRHFHNTLRPKSYIEIGIESGRALALAAANTRAIGIDPDFKIIHSLIASTNLFRLTSDDFFANFDPVALLGVDVIDFAFIDGLHTFDQALKDFIYIEHYAGPKTVVIFHDIYPITKETSTRERTTVFWTGDTWKVIPALRASRPDLKIFTIPTFPSGLGVITNLDPKSTILVDNFEFILKECFTWNFEAIDGAQNEILNVVPNDPVIVSELICF